MEQLTDAEFDALLGPEMLAFVETLPASDLEALANGDPAALRRCQCALKRWGDGRA